MSETDPGFENEKSLKLLSRIVRMFQEIAAEFVHFMAFAFIPRSVTNCAFSEGGKRNLRPWVLYFKLRKGGVIPFENHWRCF
jgi:hypothetical protein